MVGWDDTEVLVKMRADGHRGVWVGSAKVKHYIPKNRLTLSYVWKYYQGNGQAEARMSPPLEKCGTLWGAPRWLVQIFLAEFARFLVLYPRKSSEWVESLKRSAHLSGLIEQAREDRFSPTRGQPAADERILSH